MAASSIGTTPSRTNGRLSTDVDELQQLEARDRRQSQPAFDDEVTDQLRAWPAAADEVDTRSVSTTTRLATLLSPPRSWIAAHAPAARRACPSTTCESLILWDCASLLQVTKNITVSVPDDVHRRARIRAAEHGVSVSALVREFLVSLADDDREFDRLEAQQRRIQEEIDDFRGGDRLGRDEVHDRALR